MSTDTILMFADTVRSPDLRYRIPHTVADPFLYIEHAGTAHVVCRSLEVERMRGVPGLEPHADEEFGLDQLQAAGVPNLQVPRQIALNVCQHLGIKTATVPPDFPLAMGDFLRANGVELTVDDDSFVSRRRVKTPTQLEGMRRAQRGAEAAVDAITALLSRATVSGDAVLLNGEALTSEMLKAAARQAFAESGVSADEFIVAHGFQTCVGHHMGSGPIGAGEPITVDLWPRDEETGCFTDMTRTYVVGEPPEELLTYHRLSREALDRSIAVIAPGANVRDVHGAACDVFEAAGYPTQRTKKPGEVLLDGFFHSLGHGVGLEVHEAPGLSQNGAVLVEGDVVAVEPGCYRQGFGGARLEDLVLVTATGAEVITNYRYGLDPSGSD
jgi:Xaa-Pro aminopeptidase